jgi:hypothetical protein
VVIEHIVDRACIGRCFSYDDYEPATGQFRVHAAPGNSIAAADPPDDLDDAAAERLVKALDPPVFLISQCEESGVRICARELSTAEMRDLVEGKFEQ